MATTAVPKNGRSDLDFYLSHGYVSMEGNSKAPSNTLTYAFDDYILSRLSMLDGNKEDALSALNRSHNYRNIWSKERRLMCPRHTDGTFQCPIKPTSVATENNYQEVESR